MAGHANVSGESSLFLEMGRRTLTCALRTGCIFFHKSGIFVAQPADPDPSPDNDDRISGYHPSDGNSPSGLGV